MSNKRTLEELFSDPQLGDRLKDRLYSKERLLEKGSPFSEVLQGMVSTMLDAEIEGLLDEEQASGKTNFP